jgi:hypothetical protein
MPVFRPFYLPSDLLQALGEHTGHFWSDPAMESVICDAVRAWMKPAPAAAPSTTTSSGAGYQWKNVFLPEGTKLRASFGHQPWSAVVEGAEIRYDGHSISPSRFANLQGSGNRNAWKAIWLRLPGSDEWILADAVRTARKASVARLLGTEVHEAKLPPHEKKAVACCQDHRKGKRAMGQAPVKLLTYYSFITDAAQSEAAGRQTSGPRRSRRLRASSIRRYGGTAWP